MIGNIRVYVKDSDAIDELNDAIENHVITGASSEGMEAVIHYRSRDKVKPRTKTTYEKVEFEYAWQYLKEHEEGVEFYSKSETILDDEVYLQVGDVRSLLDFAIKGNLYRKVEREVTWKDELNDFLDGCERLKGKGQIYNVIPQSCTDSEKQFDNEFIKMCHLVASLTDKPE